MCGRYTLVMPPQLWLDQFSITGGHLDLAPRFNIAPTQQVPVVRSSRGENNLSLMRWGLVPFWAKERNTRYAMINARDDKILETRSYVGPFKSKRCLIPATGYFEWQKGPGKSKQPMLIRLKTGEPFAFAGIWELWHDRADPGAPEQRSADLINCVLSCSIITTAPNALMEPIHDRMPVILSPELYQEWMDPANQDLGGLKEMLLPFDPGLMEAFPVSSRVNSARNEGPDLVEPVQQAEFGSFP